MFPRNVGAGNAQAAQLATAFGYRVDHAVVHTLVRDAELPEIAVVPAQVEGQLGSH